MLNFFFSSRSAAFFAGLALIAAGAACGSESASPTTSSSGPTGPTTNASSSATGGSGATGGAGGTTSTGGAATTSTGSGGIGPSDNACVGDFAFRAIGMSFATPTPEALGQELNLLAYDGMEHPITIVLRSSDPAAATIGASASEDGGNTVEVFIAGLEPVFGPATVLEGSFGGAAVPSGFLRLRAPSGELDIKLINLYITVGTSSDCQQGVVNLVASIPAAERSTAFTGSNGPTTIGTLAGGDASSDINFHAVFITESVDFDFSTL